MVSNSIAIFFVHRPTAAAAVSEKLGRYPIKLTLNESKSTACCFQCISNDFIYFGGDPANS